MGCLHAPYFAQAIDQLRVRFHQLEIKPGQDAQVLVPKDFANYEKEISKARSILHVSAQLTNTSERSMTPSIIIRQMMEKIDPRQ